MFNWIVFVVPAAVAQMQRYDFIDNAVAPPGGLARAEHVARIYLRDHDDELETKSVFVHGDAEYWKHSCYTMANDEKAAVAAARMFARFQPGKAVVYAQVRGFAESQPAEPTIREVSEKGVLPS